MVKRTIVIITIAILLLTLAITEVVLVKNFIIEIENEVNRLVVLYEENQEDITPFADDMLTLERKWDDREQLLCLMFNHKDMSALTDCMTRVLAYTKQNNYDDAIVELRVLQEYASKNHDIMGCNFNNIL